MKLKQIELQNFMLYEKLVFEVKPGLTVITGPTDTGKSAIIHAVKWVVTNKIKTGFVRDNAKFCCVKLVFEDGTVTRYKDSKTNQYELEANGTNVTFKALRGKVPQEIKDFLKMGNINFQDQFDNHFLISETDGKISKRINELVNLQEIDRVNEYIKSKLFALRTVKKTAKEQLKNAKAAVKKLEWVEKLKDKSELLQQEFDVLCQAKDKLTTYARIIYTLEKTKKKQEKLDGIVGTIRSKKEKLIQTKAKLNELDELKKTLNKLIRTLDQIDIKREKEAVEKLKKKQSQVIYTKTELIALKEKQGEFEDVADDVERFAKKKMTIASQVRKLKKDKEELLHEIGICPLCGQETR